jgi:hypothetical protein
MLMAGRDPDAVLDWLAAARLPQVSTPVGAKPG